MKTRILVVSYIWLLSLILLTACGKPVESTAVNPVTESPVEVVVTESVSATETTAATEAPGVTEVPVNAESIINEQCVTCHGLSRITSTKASLEQWQSIVERMIQKGAKLTDAEKAVLVQYLADNYK